MSPAVGAGRHLMKHPHLPLGVLEHSPQISSHHNFPVQSLTLQKKVGRAFQQEERHTCVRERKWTANSARKDRGVIPSRREKIDWKSFGVKTFMEAVSQTRRKSTGESL